MALPLGVLWSEVRLTQHRIRQMQATDAILARAAGVDVQAGGNNLGEALERISNG